MRELRSELIRLRAMIEEARNAGLNPLDNARIREVFSGVLPMIGSFSRQLRELFENLAEFIRTNIGERIRDPLDPYSLQVLNKFNSDSLNNFIDLSIPNSLSPQWPVTTATELVIKSSLFNDTTPVRLLNDQIFRDNTMHIVAVNGGGLALEMLWALLSVVAIFGLLMVPLTDIVPTEPIYDILVNWSSISSSVSEDLMRILWIRQQLPSWLTDVLNPTINLIFRDLHSPVTHALKDFVNLYKPP